MAEYAACAFCHEPIDPDSRLTWKRTIGWARPGKAGGSDVVLRRQFGAEFAHDHCIEKEKAGLAVGQISFVD
jgi:hypothetical protein